VAAHGKIPSRSAASTVLVRSSMPSLRYPGLFRRFPVVGHSASGCIRLHTGTVAGRGALACHLLGVVFMLTTAAQLLPSTHITPPHPPPWSVTLAGHQMAATGHQVTASLYPRPLPQEEP
jgi:hypothetical protein